MEKLFPIVYGKDYIPPTKQSSLPSTKGAIAKQIIKTRFWEIVEIEVAKLQLFNNGLEGVRNANAMEVLRVFNLYLANL
tara:strand:- start:649 stop:885 length:237 start_codon:yes stop_codon:yes gene_type:complete